jgi:DNA-binding NtrC family response regulator
VAVVDITVPPLRERASDIEPLARHFVDRVSGARELAIPPHVVDALRARAWPGNVRELMNACERLVVLCPEATLRVEDLPDDVATGSHVVATGEVVSEWPPLPADGLPLIDLEKEVIRRVLQLKNGNVSQAAAYLSVPRHFLAYRIQKYGLR